MSPGSGQTAADLVYMIRDHPFLVLALVIAAGLHLWYRSYNKSRYD